MPLLGPVFKQRRYRKGEIMAKQGELADTLFYIQSGECEVLHNLDADGDEDFMGDVSPSCLPPSLYICTGPSASLSL